MKQLQTYSQENLEKDKRANDGRPYQQCSISVMDTIADPAIRFDDKGICNYYYEYLDAEKNNVFKGEKGKETLTKAIDKIKTSGKGKKYDCILGVSGGVDSTYLAYLAAQHDLRVLCVHFDNGWNSELAVKNIENFIKKLDFDLYTYVIDWNEFKDIQKSYFKAHVIDIEAVTDIAIFSALDRICSDQKISYVIDGRNVVTEHVLPLSWVCKDAQNLLNIHEKFGTVPIESYPLLSPFEKAKRQLLRPFESIKILNFVEYNKAEVKQKIIEELEWRDYGGKHYESVFTRFYQGYILPRKFNVDKRKAHLSNLIFAGQITKEQAQEELNQPMYNAETLKDDYDFVLKKLDFDRESFETYLKTPPKSHKEYGLSGDVYDQYPYLKPFRGIYRMIKKWKNDA